MKHEHAIIVNDPDMTHCPECLRDGAEVRLHSARGVGKFCEYHGQITSEPPRRRRTSRRDVPREANSGATP